MNRHYKADPALWAAAERNGTAYPMDMINLTLELLARVEALEAERRPDHLGDANKMVTNGSLVDRVANAVAASFENGPYAEGADRWDEQAARAAICEVAAWLREQGDAQFFCTGLELDKQASPSEGV